MAISALSTSLLEAIATLEGTARHLQVQLEATHTAINALRAVTDSASVARPSKPRKPRRTSIPSGHAANDRTGAPGEPAVRELLKHGPVTVAMFRKTFELNPLRARKALSDLEQRGIVAVTGNKAARRIALAGSMPAKEAL